MQVWKPEPLTWPARHRWEDGRVDDVDRHIAARVRLGRVVEVVCKAKPREFPARVYRTNDDAGALARATLLENFGGLPRQEGGRLGGVPAAQLEQAVRSLAEAFGLEEVE